MLMDAVIKKDWCLKRMCFWLCWHGSHMFFFAVDLGLHWDLVVQFSPAMTGDVGCPSGDVLLDQGRMTALTIKSICCLDRIIKILSKSHRHRICSRKQEQEEYRTLCSVTCWFLLYPLLCYAMHRHRECHNHQLHQKQKMGLEQFSQTGHDYYTRLLQWQKGCYFVH
jgi:hypothetical protein